MGTRIELQATLKAVLGSNNVYFQPPESIKLQYPCIIYELTDIRAHMADNIKYKHLNKYNVMVIDSNPDSQIPRKVLDLPYSAFNRQYVADNLYHSVIELYF